MAADPAMRVVGVTRVLNEAPIVEAFVRHHAGLLDLHILLDNGSTDDTLPILRRLRDEGVALQVYQTISVIEVETIYLTGLYRLALQEGADWVAFLDCDELLDPRRLEGGLAQWLGAQSADVACLYLPLMEYLAASPSTAAAASVFERLVRRRPGAAATKVLVRRIEGDRVAIGVGSHSIVLDGALVGGAPQTELVLAHYPQRSPAQFALRAAIWRLKSLADGTTNAPLNLGWQYVEPFETMQRAPRQWLADMARAGREPADLVDDPGPYRGGGLRYTGVPDDDARLVALLLVHAERLARSHGDLLDRTPGLRDAVREQSARARRVF